MRPGGRAHYCYEPPRLFPQQGAPKQSKELNQSDSDVQFLPSAGPQPQQKRPAAPIMENAKPVAPATRLSHSPTLPHEVRQRQIGEFDDVASVTASNSLTYFDNPRNAVDTRRPRSNHFRQSRFRALPRNRRPSPLPSASPHRHQSITSPAKQKSKTRIPEASDSAVTVTIPRRTTAGFRWSCTPY